MTDLKFITPAYWSGVPSKTIDIKHNFKLPYSKEKRNQIIDIFMLSDYNIMIQHVPDGIIIWADKGRFRQT